MAKGPVRPYVATENQVNELLGPVVHMCESVVAMAINGYKK
jgi:hypothetical protein